MGSSGNSIVRITAANTASDGSGTLFSLLSGGTNGSRIDAVRFRDAGPGLTASSAMVHRIFLSDTTGANFRLVGEVATSAATRSASAVGAASIFNFDQPLIIKSGQVLSVCQSVYAGTQDQMDALVYAGDY